MIFKHEYLVTEDERKVYDLDRLHEKRREVCAYELGKKIIEVLEWKAVEQSKHLDPYTERYKLEIITFPMDKWVEFKQNLFEYLHVSGGDVSGKKILEMINDLEFYSNNKQAVDALIGKPSGDTITNQQLNK